MIKIASVTPDALDPILVHHVSFEFVLSSSYVQSMKWKNKDLY